MPSAVCAQTAQCGVQHAPAHTHAEHLEVALSGRHYSIDSGFHGDLERASHTSPADGAKCAAVSDSAQQQNAPVDAHSLSTVEMRLARAVLGYDASKGDLLKQVAHARRLPVSGCLAHQVWHCVSHRATRDILGWRIVGDDWVGRDGVRVAVNDFRPLECARDTWRIVQALQEPRRLACCVVTNGFVRFHGYRAPSLLLAEVPYEGSDVLPAILAAAALAYANALEVKGRLFAAAAAGDLRKLATVVAEGAFIDWTDDLGETPLFAAAAGGHAACCRFLLHRGANPNARDWKGCTPLHVAASRGWSFVVDVLELFGAVRTFRICYDVLPANSSARRRDQAGAGEGIDGEAVDYDGYEDDDCIDVSLERFRELKALLERGQLSIGEFEHRKCTIVDRMTGTSQITPPEVPPPQPPLSLEPWALFLDIPGARACRGCQAADARQALAKASQGEGKRDSGYASNVSPALSTC